MNNVPWPRNSPEHRWYAFGRYYAMFPPSFAFDAVNSLTRPGETVIDPFCGRGNGPFTAAVLDRPSLGIDVNPLAWLYTEVKLHPEPNLDRLLGRLEELGRAGRQGDRNGRTKFERMAWSPTVRAFLKAARRELDWQHSTTDRTLMAFIVLHMQDKAGGGLSNGLWPTIACSADYAVRWWGERNMNDPPEVDPVVLLSDKIRRRYRFGIPSRAASSAVLADARDTLRELDPIHADLLITSPPYNGVTDYWNEHWIRLWMLGNPFRKDWKRAAKHSGREQYSRLIHDVLGEAKRHLTEGAAILVRSDLRRNTLATCVEALQIHWPRRKLLIRKSVAPHKGVSMHHGRGGSTTREVDLLMPGHRAPSWVQGQGFEPLTGAVP